MFDKKLDLYHAVLLVLVAALLVFLSATAYWAISDVRHKTTALHKGLSRAQVKLEEIRAGIGNLRRFEKDVVIHIHDEGEQQRYLRRWNTELEAALEDVATLLGYEHLPDSLRFDFKKIESGLLKYRVDANEVLQQAMTEGYLTSHAIDEELEPFKKPARDLDESLSGYVQSIADIEKEVFNAVVGASEKAQQRVLGASLAVLFVVLVLGSFVVMASTKRKARYVYEAEHDLLTGYTNRLGLEKRLVESQMEWDSRPFLVAFCRVDLDNFVLVDKKHGYLVASEYLRRMTLAINDDLPEGTIMSRLSEDKFVYVFPVADEHDAIEKTDSIRASISQYSTMEHGTSISTTACAGLLVEEVHDLLIEDAVNRSDIACRLAKEGGRDRTVLHDDRNPEIIKYSKDVEAAKNIIQHVLEGRFDLYFQRIKKVGGEACCCELLLRYENDQGACVSAYPLILCAKRFGMLAMLDRFAFDTTMKYFERGAFDTFERVSLNLSSAGLQDAKFRTHVLQTLGREPEVARRLCCEITEDTVIDDHALLSDFMLELGTLGVIFALDDFGVGSATYENLKNMPFHHLKVDGSFIKNIENSDADRVIVSSIIVAGQTLGLEVVAEFVETEDQVAILSEMGIDFVQGYLIHEPEPIAGHLI